MNDVMLNSATIGVVISLISYEIGMALKKKYKIGLFNPLLIAIILTIVFLLVFHIDYDAYNVSGKYLSYLLTPATVSLAIPLYMQMQVLKDNFWAVFGGIISGVLTSLMTIFLMALLFGLSHEEYVTLLPKSITTAIGMGVSEELGGYVTITVAVIVITGVLGNMIADLVCKTARIKHAVTRGL